MKYGDWLTKEQAAGRLDVSVKTIERLSADGKIQKRMRSRVGGSPLAVFHPGDVDRLASERSVNEPFVLSKDEPMPGPNGRQLVPAGSLKTLVEALSSLSKQQSATAEESGAVSLADLAVKRYLTVEEAIAYTGLGEFHITEKVEGKPIGPHAKLVYRRADLDKL